MASDTAPALSSRLAAVAELVPFGARVADIGCDHGLLSRYLVTARGCEVCIATEIDEAALGRAGRTSTASEIERISWRVGDGLAPIDVADRIDTIVLAGLGAASIVRILDTPRLSRLAGRRLVVQPQTAVASVRGWLHTRRWTIVEETVVRDRGRFYEIASAEPGDVGRALDHPLLSRADVLAVGPILVRGDGEEVVALWESRRARLERIVAEGARGAMADKAAFEAARARRILAALRGIDPT